MKKEQVQRRPRTRSMSDAPDEALETPKVDPAADAGNFSNFVLSKTIVKKLKANGIEYLFPTQVKCYNEVLEGHDLIMQARTGSGKTLAFGLPLLQKLMKTDDELFTVNSRAPMVLMLAPTRELALQISKELEKFKPKKVCISCFYGGTMYDKQMNELRRGVDIVVGTPGRILDLINRGSLNISTVKHVVLDEADRMMDMGFQESLTEILQKAYTEDNKPQTLLFSATVPTWLKETAQKYMSKDAKKMDLIEGLKNKSSITVEHKALKCPYQERPSVIRDVIQVYSGKHGRTIIFTATKVEANELSMSSVINMESQVLHGDIQQQHREITLQSFRDGKFNCLIATDVAARGLDIPEVDPVIQTEPPKDIDSYIHRAGRTARAGRTGICIIFYKPNTEYMLNAVEKKAGITFTRIGAPQQADILKAKGEDAVRSLDSVNSSVLEVFLPAAEKLIAERGAEKALATCLAVISGTTELSSRSLLSSFQNYTTYHMYQNLEMHGSGLIWNTLRRYFDADLVDGIKGMRMTKDKLGCVFDVPNDKLTALKEAWTGDRYCTLEAITELPELLEGQNFRQNQNRNNGGGQSRGGGFNNGQRNGFNRKSGPDNSWQRKRSNGQTNGGPPAKKKWT